MAETLFPARSHPGFRILLAGSEYAWLYPLIALAFSLFPGFIAPDPAIVFGAFGLGCLVTGLLKGQGLRRIVLLIAQAFVLGLDIYVAVAHRYGNPFRLSSPETFMGAFEFALVAGWATAVWYRAMRLMNLEATPGVAGNCLDLGVGMFLATALLGWGLHSPVADMEKYIILLFVAGAGSMAAANRAREDIVRGGDDSEMPRHGMRTFLAGVSGIVFSACIAIWIFGTPGLATATRAGLVLIGRGFSAFLPWILAILTSLLGTQSSVRYSTDDGGSAVVRPGSSVASGKANPLLDLILLWGLKLAIFAVVVLLAAAILPPLMRWLFGKSEGSERDGRRLAEFRAFLARIAAWILGMAHFRDSRSMRARSHASLAYRKLLKWGRIARCGPRTWETVLEYGARISSIFPEIATEARLVSRNFSAEYYGIESGSTKPSPIPATSNRSAIADRDDEARQLLRAQARLASPRRRLLSIRIRRFARKIALRLSRHAGSVPEQ